MMTDHEESLLISEIDALSLQLADALLLRREPDNVHDELAIVVLTVTAQKLGYLARVTSITRSFKFTEVTNIYENLSFKPQV